MSNVRSWLAEAGLRHDKGDLAGAEHFYLQVLRADARNIAACDGLGLIRLRQGRTGEALELIGGALTIAPGRPEALCNYGNALRAAGRFVEALASYDRALAARPRMMQALFNRGNVLNDLGRLDEAVACFDGALAAEPELAQAWNNRGNALRGLKRLREALDSYARALSLRPGHAPILANRAQALRDIGQLREALESSGQAVAAAPHFAEALYTRGSILFDLHRAQEALACFERAVDADATHPFALGALARCALMLCDWDRTQKIAPLLKADIEAGRSAIQPFTLLGYWDDSALQARCADLYLRRILPPRPEPLWRGGARRSGKIRLAYLSADFRNSAAAYLTAELFERHDRDRFEVTAISFGADDGSPMRARLAQAFDAFHDVRAMSDRAAAEQMRALDIDIAVDLMGYTMDARPGILAHRPCPVQVSFLGYPGPMAADFIDYVIGDAVVLPTDRQAHYAEKIVRLPGSYYPRDSTTAAAAQTQTRIEAELPEDGFVFCCFNNGWKITRPVFAVWMRLLAHVRGSVLWLLEPGMEARANLQRQAEAHGINPARLVFAARLPPDRHLARHRLADLFLDTLPYNAHTTASDALWAGLPVITCMGESFAARVAASLLQAAGLPELVTQGLDAYETLAQKLAQDPAQLAAIRRQLKHNRFSAPLFDMAAYREHLEAAYARMHEGARVGKKPALFPP